MLHGGAMNQQAQLHQVLMALCLLTVRQASKNVNRFYIYESMKAFVLSILFQSQHSLITTIMLYNAKPVCSRAQGGMWHYIPNLSFNMFLLDISPFV